MEFVNVYARKPKDAQTDALYKILLQNQFHDILPGTSIASVNERARREVSGVIQRARAHTGGYILKRLIATKLLGEEDGLRTFEGQNADNAAASLKGSGHVTLVNTLSHARSDAVILPDEGMTIGNAAFQRYKDPLGRAQIACVGVTLEPLSMQSFALTPCGPDMESAFKVSPDATCVETPLYVVQFDECGYIASLQDKRADGRELRRAGGEPLGTLYLGEDVPADWDNWDIDSDQAAKLRPVRRPVSYTHLDVYKRQGRNGRSCGRAWVRCARFRCLRARTFPPPRPKPCGRPASPRANSGCTRRIRALAR